MGFVSQRRLLLFSLAANHAKQQRTLMPKAGVGPMVFVTDAETINQPETNSIHMQQTLY
jgi:hypothetical protein